MFLQGVMSQWAVSGACRTGTTQPHVSTPPTDLQNVTRACIPTICFVFILTNNKFFARQSEDRAL